MNNSRKSMDMNKITSFIQLYGQTFPRKNYKRNPPLAVNFNKTFAKASKFSTHSYQRKFLRMYTDEEKARR